MTLDIERIKTTTLGRLWLSRFVERVWSEVLTHHQRHRMLESVHAHKSERDSRHSPRDLYGSRGWRFIADDRLARLGLAGAVERSRRRLTPLGVEVYLYGRRQAGKRGGR